MPIEYEMMYLKKTVEEAVSQYTQTCYSSAWLSGIENAVLDVLESEPGSEKYFQDYQVTAMRELIKRGYWIKYDEDIGHTILYRLNR